MADILETLKAKDPERKDRDCVVHQFLHEASEQLRTTNGTLHVNLLDKIDLSIALRLAADVLEGKDVMVRPFSALSKDPRAVALRRRTALEMKAFFEKQEREGKFSPLSRPIETAHLLDSCAEPLKGVPKERREEFKARFSDVLKDTSNKKDPCVVLLASIENDIPSVPCGIKLSAVDGEDGMPTQYMQNTVALWDTGAHMTTITDDMLNADFRNFVQKHQVHDPYRFNGLTRVQLSCRLEFSNRTMIEIDAIALVVPKDQIPNFRSGILLGQRGVLDKMHHEVIPRAFCSGLSDEYWGRINIKKYVDWNDEVQDCSTTL